MANNISLCCNEDNLAIEIHTQQEDNPTATIINYSGETIEQFRLRQGSNDINIAAYLNKNCSVRIRNGKNVVVQKI